MILIIFGIHPWDLFIFYPGIFVRSKAEESQENGRDHKKIEGPSQQMELLFLTDLVGCFSKHLGLNSQNGKKSKELDWNNEIVTYLPFS